MAQDAACVVLGEKVKKRPGQFNWHEYGYICDRLSEGMSPTAIAKEMGISESTMHERLRKIGMLPPPKERKKRKAPINLDLRSVHEVWFSVQRH